MVSFLTILASPEYGPTTDTDADTDTDTDTYTDTALARSKKDGLGLAWLGLASCLGTQQKAEDLKKAVGCEWEE